MHGNCSGDLCLCFGIWKQQVFLMTQLIYLFTELRLTVRSSLTRKERKEHVHEFGPESYDEDEDMYSKTCKTCKHTVSYEKM